TILTEERHVLLEDLPGTASAVRPKGPARGDGEVAVLPNDEEAIAPDDPAQERDGAEVAVTDPEICCDDALQNLSEERPLMCMRVFARNHIDRQHQGGVQDNEGLPRQGPCLDLAQHGQTVFRSSEVIPINDLDAVTREQRRHLATEFLHDGAETRSNM